VLYRKYINRGIRNVAISTFISGIVVLIAGIIFNVIKSFFIDSIGTPKDNVEEKLLEYITNILDTIGSRTIIVGVVYIVLSVICTILVIVVKKKMSAGNDGTLDSGTYTMNLVK